MHINYKLTIKAYSVNKQKSNNFLLQLLHTAFVQANYKHLILNFNFPCINQINSIFWFKNEPITRKIRWFTSKPIIFYLFVCLQTDIKFQFSFFFFLRSYQIKADLHLSESIWRQIVRITGIRVIEIHQF